MSFSIGEQVGPYQITAQLGSGGMATVFKAYHAALDRYVAIKVLHPAFKQDPNFLSRFQREARIVAKLEHPHIVPVFDFSEANGQPYLVMRFIEGETLKAHLATRDLSVADVRRVIKPVADALAYAHGQGVLHRDVKPSNILLTLEGGVYLADFGLARIAQAGESTLSQDSLLGTPQYISPEQAQGQSDLDARTDIYSLGVVVYELLVGRVPYQADTPYAVIHDHIYAPLPLPRSIKPDFSEVIERVLLKALTKDRADRYASANEFYAALDRAIDQASAPSPIIAVISHPIEPTIPIGLVASTDPLATRAVPVVVSKSKTKMWLALGALGLIIIAIVAVLALRAPQSTAPQPVAPNNTPPGGVPANGAPSNDAPDSVVRLRADFAQANTLASQGQIDQARGKFADVATRAEQQLAQPGAPAEQQTPLRVIAGDSWLAANEPAKAQTQFEVLVRQSPGNEELQTALAATQLMQNNLDAADAALSRALRANADYAAAHAFKACALLKRSEPVVAAREFRQSGLADLKTPVAPWVRLVLAELDCRPERFRP
ncbi:MAG: protein kinase [Thermoflexales bacterium]|nr:protein kinase [Thermoflexales bacterium]